MTEKIVHEFKNGETKPPLTEIEIQNFEHNYSLSIPLELKKLYMKMNGGYDGELLTFYSLEELRNINEFDFGYILGNENCIKNEIWKIDENKKYNCLINNPNNYYCFLNYNFGGGYWFINLNKNDSKYEEIILLYNHINEYYICQRNIKTFFEIFYKHGAEMLLDSETEIEKYIKKWI